MMIGLWFAAFGASRIPDIDGDLPGLIGSPDLSVWVAVLLIQSLPYTAAVVVSMVSALGLRAGWIGEAGANAEIEPRHAAVPTVTEPGHNPASLSMPAAASERPSRP